MGADGALRVAAARLAPREALLQHRDPRSALARGRSQLEARARGALGHRLLVDALGNPAVALAGEDHARLVALVADRHEVGAVLLDAGAVVHQHELQVARSASRGAARSSAARAACSMISRCQPRSVAAAWASAASAARTLSSQVRPGGGRAHGRPRKPSSSTTSTITPSTIRTIASVDMPAGVKGRAWNDEGRPAGGLVEETAATYSPRAARPKYHRR